MPLNKETKPNLRYSELKDGKRNTGRRWLWYRDKLKYNLSAPKILVGSFEDLALGRNKMKSHHSEWNKGFWSKSNWEIKGGTRVSSTQPSIISETPHSCSICGLVCKSLAGLKSHNHPWCNGYRPRKWTRRHEFKSWPRLIAFHIALIPLGKVWIQLFSFQLWVNRRADKVL